MYVGVSLNSIQFFLPHVQEILQKCALKCTTKRLRQIPVQNRIYNHINKWDAKYIPTIFLSLRQLAKLT
jgi:hypothetical protein